MTNSSTDAGTPPRRRWLRWLLWLATGVVVLVVAVYFIATSSAFFKAVILPKVSAALQADVSVSDAAISPFSSVVLQDLKVTPKGGEPVFAAKSISAKYSLVAI